MKRYQGPLCLTAAFTLAGTSVIAAKLVSDRLGTFTIAAASLFFALLFLIPACGPKLLRSLRALDAPALAMTAAQAMYGIFLFRMFLLSGLRYTSAAEAGILTGATPAFTSLLAVLLLREPVGKIGLAGICATVIGVLLIQNLLGAGFSAAHLKGNLLVLAAAASESSFNILSRLSAVRAAAKTGTVPAFDPLVQTTLVSAAAFILCMAAALFESPFRALAAIGAGQWLALAWYGLFVTALAFACWYAGIKRCGAFTAAAFSGMMPFTAMLLSALLLKEPSGWQQGLGGALVISGMILIGVSKVPDKKSLHHK